MLERIWSAISSIPNKIQELVTFVGGFFDELANSLSDLVDDLSPFFTDLLNIGTTIYGFLSNNLGLFFTGLGNTIGSFFDSLGIDLSGWFDDVFNWFSDIDIDLGGWFSDLFDDFGELLGWIGDFFETFVNTLIRLFKPVSGDMDYVVDDLNDVKSSFRNHLPFVSLFSDELENAKSIVYNEDFLNIKFQSWNFDLGVIHYSTPEINFTGVLNAYEPYRMSIRTFLTFIVYALFIVHIVKAVIRHGQAESSCSPIDK